MNDEAITVPAPGPGSRWRSITIYAAICIGCLGVFATGVTRRGLGILAVTYTVRFLGVSIGYHRYFSHRSFRTTRAMQFLLGVWATLGFQRGVLWWAQTHRDHHRHADTGKDLNSPTQRDSGTPIVAGFSNTAISKRISRIFGISHPTPNCDGWTATRPSL